MAISETKNKSVCVRVCACVIVVISFHKNDIKTN